jgi:hypothetical protein
MLPGNKNNPRFVITNIPAEGIFFKSGEALLEGGVSWLYEKGYCERGNAENMIKQMAQAMLGGVRLRLLKVSVRRVHVPFARRFACRIFSGKRRIACRNVLLQDRKNTAGMFLGIGLKDSEGSLA